jgi:hypothetical protein
MKLVAFWLCSRLPSTSLCSIQERRSDRLLNMWPLIVFVETHFGISIEDTDLLQENFQTLRTLNFIESKLNP